MLRTAQDNLICWRIWRREPLSEFLTPLVPCREMFSHRRAMELGMRHDALFISPTSFAVSCTSAVVSLAVSCRIDFTSFPSSHTEIDGGFSRKLSLWRTVKYQSDRILNIFHFIIDTLYRVVDTLGDLQDLSGCHPNFLLCQFVQSLESVLDICLSQ